MRVSFNFPSLGKLLVLLFSLFGSINIALRGYFALFAPQPQALSVAFGDVHGAFDDWTGCWTGRWCRPRCSPVSTPGTARSRTRGVAGYRPLGSLVPALREIVPVGHTVACLKSARKN